MRLHLKSHWNLHHDRSSPPPWIPPIVSYWWECTGVLVHSLDKGWVCSYLGMLDPSGMGPPNCYEQWWVPSRCCRELNPADPQPLCHCNPQAQLFLRWGSGWDPNWRTNAPQLAHYRTPTGAPAHPNQRTFSAHFLFVQDFNGSPRSMTSGVF